MVKNVVYTFTQVIYINNEIDGNEYIQLGKLDIWHNQLVNALDIAFALCTILVT